MKNFVNMRRLFCSAAVAAIAGVTAPAMAQTSVDPTAEPEAANSALGEILVTAQRRSERLQDVGASITAAGTEELNELNVRRVEDLVAITPGLKQNSPFGEGAVPLFSIRGVTVGSFALNISRPIAMYTDDAIRGMGALEFAPIYDVERVEVLKGPQGSLYGLNAVGGAINIITKKPGFSDEGYLTVGYGDYDRREARGAAQTTLIADKLAIRGAFTVVKADGYIKNTYPGGRDPTNVDLFSGRLSLLAKPTTDLTVALTLSRSTSDNDGYSGGGVVPGQFYKTSRNTDSYNRLRNTSGNLNVKYDLGGVLLTSITAYDTGSFVSRADEDYTPLDGADDTYDIHGIKQLYQELRVQSDGNRAFKWLLGASYLHDRANIYNAYLLFNDPSYNHGPAGDPGNLAINYGNSFRQRHRNMAAFARIDLAPIERVHAYVGARYQGDTIEGDRLSAFGDYKKPGVVGSPNPFIQNLSARRKETKLSVEAGIDVKPADGLLVYASFKQGFRGPALNSQVFFSPSELTIAKAETIDSYEAGFKWEYAQIIRLNAAIFRSDYKDSQYLGLLPNSFSAGLVNAGNARIDGIEVEAKLAPAEGVSLGAAGVFLKPKYRDFLLNNIDRSGQQIVLAPKRSYNFNAQFDVGDVAAGQLSLRADETYQSRIYFDAANDPLVSDDGHWLTSARLDWKADSGRWSAGLWGRNITGSHYFTYGFDTRPFFGFIQRQRGAPRSYGADLTFNF